MFLCISDSSDETDTLVPRCPEDVTSVSDNSSNGEFILWKNAHTKQSLTFKLLCSKFLQLIIILRFKYLLMSKLETNVKYVFRT